MTITQNKRVLIESDWNLKPEQITGIKVHETGINRIRLEFKVHMD